MTVEEKIQEILAASAAVTALVPAASIRVPGDWQNLDAPYIVHRPVAPDFVHCSGSSPAQSLRIWRFYQISIFAATYSGARAIADAVRGALDGYSDSVTSRIVIKDQTVTDYETDRKLQQFVLDFEVAGQLE